MLTLNRRILVVDDNPDIHSDFRKILGHPKKKQSRINLRAIEQELFADENEGGEEALKEAVRVEYEIDSAYQGREAMEMVRAAYRENRPYALVFMDVRMPPGIDGIESISLIWKEFPNVEMVICTAYSDYSFEEILEKLGSTDRLLFLTKPFDSIAVKQMALSLTRKWTLHEEARRHVLRLQDEIDQRKESEKQLHYLIHHDQLTGLPNRNQLQVCLDDAIQNARKNHTRFALFFIDLDRFKEVIDTLGYQNGDKLIRQIAERLHMALSHNGQVFCQGGEEFALLMPEITSLAHTSHMADSIRKAFEPNFDLDGLNIEIQPNVGIVIYPDHGCNRDMLMRHADMTLVSAKKAERGYRFYQETINLFNPQRLTLLTDLRQALQGDDLLLYFQPKVLARTEKIVGVESLIRWPHASHGFISPGKFIPLAERCGLIKQVTDWILMEVPKHWAYWKSKGMDLHISINLTGHELHDPSLPQRIREALEPYEMPFDRIGFEVSEKGVMIDPEQAAHILSMMADMGSTIAIDNFGRGYSSLAYLKTLPVKEIKIDPSFINEVGDHPNEIAIVRSMIDLGHNLGLQVLAEGVNTRVAYQALRTNGCDFLQGDYINNPVPSGELRNWLKESKWRVETETELAGI